MTALPEFNLFGERTPPPPPPKTSYAQVFQAYVQAGGRLDKVQRQALGQQARKLVGQGYPIEQVVKAAGQLGREGSFPAFLGRTLREMPEPCKNGEARSRLTLPQLKSCRCASCQEWAELRAGRPLEL